MAKEEEGHSFCWGKGLVLWNTYCINCVSKAKKYLEEEKKYSFFRSLGFITIALHLKIDEWNALKYYLLKC